MSKKVKDEGIVMVFSKSPRLSNVNPGIDTPPDGQPGTEPLPLSRNVPPLIVKLNAPFLRFQSKELLPVACHLKSPRRNGEAGTPAEKESWPAGLADPANMLKFCPSTSTARLVMNR